MLLTGLHNRVIIARLQRVGPLEAMHVSVLARGWRTCGLLTSFWSKTRVDCRVVHKKHHYFVSSSNIKTFLRHFLYYLRCGQSSLAMEQAVNVMATETPVDVNNPVSAEKTTAKEATEAGKRKSDEPDEAETRARGKRRRGTGGKKVRPGERYIPPPQKRNPGVSFCQEHFSETSYYFEGGLRKVYPYYFDFKTYCKGRWIGKTLLDVFKSEFRAEPIEFYEKAAREGRIRLNETPVEDLSVVLRVSGLSPAHLHFHKISNINGITVGHYSIYDIIINTYSKAI